MTEHQKLQAICEKIWYEYREGYSYWRKDSREIIFTDKFMSKLLSNLEYAIDRETWYNFFQDLCWNLDNPVDYLHDLIIN